MNDLVTIVTVTYNAQDLLEETLLSVIKQNYQNIEYIIIDGGSTDRTIDIIKKYEDKINYWVSEPDDGIYFAMNKAIVKATGMWINFMNAGDTFVDTTTIERIINSLDEETELIYGDYICDGVIESVLNRQTITRTMPCCHQSLFVKTSLMKANPFNTSYRISADYEFMLKMHNDNRKFKYIEEPFCIYPGGGLSDQSVIQQKLEVLTLLMNNNVDINEIINSAAYRYIEKQGSTIHTKQMSEQRKQENNQLKQLMMLIKELSSIKFIYHPLEKFKSYNKLLQAYHEIRKVLK